MTKVEGSIKHFIPKKSQIDRIYNKRIVKVNFPLETEESDYIQDLLDDEEIGVLVKNNKLVIADNVKNEMTLYTRINGEMYILKGEWKKLSEGN